MKIIVSFVVASLALSACNAASLAGGNNGNLLGPELHIVGNRADPSDSKYTVELTLYKNKYIIRRCGAARFNKHWFVTAADCVDQTKYDTLQIRVPHDDPQLRSDIAFFELKNLQMKVHPGYKTDPKNNNIAVFRHRKTFMNKKNILALPRKSDQKKSFFNEPVVMSSWVHFQKSEKALEDIYMSVLATKVALPADCQKQYPNQVQEQYHICATNPGGKALSKDDVGIPLVMETRDTPILVGVASSIPPPSGSNSAPMVFTRITPFAEWIAKETSIEQPA